MPLRSLPPYWQTTDHDTVRLYCGDALKVLRRLPSGIVHTLVTSPPYFGLRDYQTGEWEGGDPGCPHVPTDEWLESQFLTARGPHAPSTDSVKAAALRRWYRPDGSCRCGASRVDQQLGNEPTPDCGTKGQAQCGECYVCKLTAVFRECRRVLRDDGTFWLNIGSSYLPDGNEAGMPWRLAFALQADGWVLRQDIIWAKLACMPESVQNRCTKSHEYIFLLARGSGYYYDAHAVKEKANGNSGWDRQRSRGVDTWQYNNTEARRAATGQSTDSSTFGQDGSRNKRSVWSVQEDRQLYDWMAEHAPEVLAEFLARNGDVTGNGVSKGSSVWKISHGGGYRGSHFAVFSPKLIEPCILAGTSEVGCCPRCGAPWARILGKTRTVTRPGTDSKAWKNSKPPGHTVPVPGEPVKRMAREKLTAQEAGNRDPERHITETRTLGWRPGCECYGLDLIEDQPSEPHQGQKEPDEVFSERYRRYEEMVAEWTEAWTRLKPLYEEALGDDGEGNYSGTVPCLVMDPFIGSGTTALVCLDKGRRCWGVDLSEEYLREHCIQRVRSDLLGRPGLRHLAAPLPGGNK